MTDASGDPVANAGVSTASSSCADQTAQVLPGVEGSITGEDLFSATTDSTGTATAAVLACPALNMVLFVQPPDGSSLAPASVNGPSAITSPTTVPVVLAPAVAVEGNELSGVLVDNNGVAQAGATITLTDSNNQSDVFSTSTASDGSFAIVAPSSTYSLSVSQASGDLQYQLNATTVDLSSESLVDQTLTVPVVPLTMSVTDQRGDPLAGASVVITQTAPGNTSQCSQVAPFQLMTGVTVSSGTEAVAAQTTDQTGTTTFTVLPCNSFGSAEFQVSVPGAPPHTPPSFVPIPSPVTAAASFTVVVNQTTVTSTFSGVAVDGSGSPLAGVQLTLSAPVANGHHVAQTAADGTFSFTVPADSDYGLTVRGGGRDPDHGGPGPYLRPEGPDPDRPPGAVERGGDRCVRQPSS